MGNRFYYQDQFTTFNADGTITRNGPEHHGTWEYLHNPEVQRHYRLIWEHGKSIDLLVLAENGQRAHVTNQGAGRTQYDVRRTIPDKPAATPDPADPVLGDWLWAYGRPVTFKADGTVVSQKDPQGVWEYLRNSEAERHYRVTWGGGRYVDTFSCLPGAATGRVVSQKGTQYNVRRSSSAEPSPSGQAPQPAGGR